MPLHAGNPSPMTGWGNWTYFLAGRAPVMIDAGVGIDIHLSAIADATAEGPGHVLVTHAHGDHIGGASAILDRWPGTHFSKMPWPERDAGVAVPFRPLSDGDVVAAGDGHLHVVHTPGHAPDHIAFWEPVSRTLFSGDLILAGTTVVIPASMGGSLAAYLRSLARIASLNPSRLLPAHGPAIEDPAAAIREYIEHREQRERQIIEGLQQGDRTMDALIARIYVGLKPALLPMARESVLAHLHKLQDEGKAEQRGGEWIYH